jgi:hypothetical protein
VKTRLSREEVSRFDDALHLLFKKKGVEDRNVHNLELLLGLGLFFGLLAAVLGGLLYQIASTWFIWPVIIAGLTHGIQLSPAVFTPTMTSHEQSLSVPNLLHYQLREEKPTL